MPFGFWPSTGAFGLPLLTVCSCGLGAMTDTSWRTELWDGMEPVSAKCLEGQESLSDIIMFLREKARLDANYSKGRCLPLISPRVAILQDSRVSRYADHGNKYARNEQYRRLEEIIDSLYFGFSRANGQ